MEAEFQDITMSAEKGNVEKMKAYMLSIYSKMDKWIDSKAAGTALMSKIVPDCSISPNQSVVTPSGPSPPTGGSMSDPKAAEGDILAVIEAIVDAEAVFENLGAYYLILNSKMDKVHELQAAFQAMTSALMKKIVQLRANVPIQSANIPSAPLPPTGSSMSNPRAAEGDFVPGGLSVKAGISEKMEAYLHLFHLMDSRLDEMIESEAAFNDQVNDLVKKFVCPNCQNQCTMHSLLAPLPPTGGFVSDPKAVGELTERLLKAKI